MENKNQGFDFHKKKEKNINQINDIDNKNNIDKVEKIETINKDNINKEDNKNTFWETDLDKLGVFFSKNQQENSIPFGRDNLSNKKSLNMIKINNNILKKVLNGLLNKEQKVSSFDYKNIRIKKQEEIDRKIDFILNNYENKKSKNMKLKNIVNNILNKFKYKSQDN